MTERSAPERKPEYERDDVPAARWYRCGRRHRDDGQAQRAGSVDPRLEHASTIPSAFYKGQEIFERSSPWWAYPLFLQNFLVPAPTNATGPLSVAWSLAVEEQFYLLWPLCLLLFFPGTLGR